MNEGALVNTLKTGLLMAFLFALLMGLGRMIGGANGLVIGFAIALVMNFGAYWFSDRIALSMGGAVEVTPAEATDLYRTVQRLADRAGLPMPRLYIIPTDQPNAFATGRDPEHAAVAVTEGLLRMLPQAELEGVLAHELAHVKHRDILISSVAATIVGAIGFVAQMLQMQAFFGGMRHEDEEDGANPLFALIGAILISVVATLVQLAISRAREYDADRGGAAICGRPLALASALRHIEAAAERMPLNVNPASAHMYIIDPRGGLMRSLAALMSTHPATDDRVARLEAMAGGRVAA